MPDVQARFQRRVSQDRARQKLPFLGQRIKSHTILLAISQTPPDKDMHLHLQRVSHCKITWTVYLCRGKHAWGIYCSSIFSSKPTCSECSLLSKQRHHNLNWSFSLHKEWRETTNAYRSASDLHKHVGTHMNLQTKPHIICEHINKQKHS